MALPPVDLTHLLVRWVHVLGMATLFGGALLTWGLLRRDGARETPAAGLQVAVVYEWLFWAGAGLIVLTGVGNLGVLAPGIPGLGTTWGATFSVKLAGVIVLLLGSLVRTLGVLGHLGGGKPDSSSSDLARLRTSYAATAVLLLAIVALAEVIAHG